MYWVSELKDPATSLQKKMGTSFKAAYFLLFSCELSWDEGCELGWDEEMGDMGRSGITIASMKVLKAN